MNTMYIFCLFPQKKWIGGRWLYWHIILSFYRNEYKNNKIGMNQFVEDHYLNPGTLIGKNEKSPFCLSWVIGRGSLYCIWGYCMRNQRFRLISRFRFRLISTSQTQSSPVPMETIRSLFWGSCQIKRMILIYSLHLRYCTEFEFRERRDSEGH